MEARLRKVEDDVVDVRERVVVLEDRQGRIHEDMKALTDALQEATAEITKINNLAAKRGAFIAGAVFVIGAFGTVIGFVLTTLKDWLGS